MTNREKLIIAKKLMLNVMVAIANEDDDNATRSEFTRAIEDNVDAVANDADDFHFAFNKFWELYE